MMLQSLKFENKEKEKKKAREDRIEVKKSEASTRCEGKTSSKNKREISVSDGSQH